MIVRRPKLRGRSEPGSPRRPVVHPGNDAVLLPRGSREPTAADQERRAAEISQRCRRREAIEDGLRAARRDDLREVAQQLLRDGRSLFSTPHGRLLATTVVDDHGCGVLEVRSEDGPGVLTCSVSPDSPLEVEAIIETLVSAAVNQAIAAESPDWPQTQ